MTTIEPRDMDSLLGAYVLDALEADERAQVELHLEQDARARREVDELLETVAALATAPGIDEPAPQALWDRIAAQIDEETPADELAARRRPQGVATGRVDHLGRRRGGRGRGDRARAAGRVAQRRPRPGASNPRPASIERGSSTAPRRPKVRAPRRSPRTTGRRGSCCCPTAPASSSTTGCPPVGAAQTYQLWAFTGNGAEPTIVSAAVLGPDADSASFKLAGPVQSFAMTVEGAGGAAQPTQAPFTTGNLS